jgi:UDP-galactopyranose mutase
MLDGTEVKLGVDFFKEKSLLTKLCKKIVYTGKIDEFFEFKHGDLDYRSLTFSSQTLDGDYQGNAIINYPSQDVPWTRITEHKHFCPEKTGLEKTVITKEYPANCGREDVPYYPIGNQENVDRFNSYKKMTSSCTNVIFGGRLAEYKYYDMHQVIASALHASKKEFGT